MVENLDNELTPLVEAPPVVVAVKPSHSTHRSIGEQRRGSGCRARSSRGPRHAWLTTGDSSGARESLPVLRRRCRSAQTPV
ncbi:hypothetical protein U1Q18_017713 [Sarracenia purpurea var. burkii]